MNTPQSEPAAKSGDMLIKSGDGGLHGDGGALNIVGGTFKTGDVISSALTTGKFRRSCQRFVGYAGDLINSDMNTFEDRIALFIDFCRTDLVFVQIHNQLLSVPGANIENWFSERNKTGGSMSGSKQLVFPTEPESRMSLMYQLLILMRDGKVNWSDFMVHFFATGSSKVDSYIYAFNAAITQPLVRELGHRLEEIEEELPKEPTTPISPAVVQVIHHATNVIQQNATGQNITQTASITNPELAQLFNELREAVERANLSPDENAEANEIIAGAEEQAASPKPRLGVIRALLKSLPSIESITSIATSIMDVLGKVL